MSQIVSDVHDLCRGVFGVSADESCFVCVLKLSFPVFVVIPGALHGKLLCFYCRLTADCGQLSLKYKPQSHLCTS